MKKSEFLKILRKPCNIYGFVRIMEHDGIYVKLNKSDIISFVSGCDDSVNFEANVNDIGDIYIN